MEEQERSDREESTPSVVEMARLIDYAIESSPLPSEQISSCVRLAASLNLASVSVPSCEADMTVRLLDATETAAASLVGYPFGAGSTAAKLYEARDLLRRGVKEIEFVVNLGKLASRQFQYVESELLQMSTSCKEYGGMLKVMLQMQHLTEDLKVIACKIAKRVEADIVVTSAYPLAGDSDDSDLLLLQRISKDVCGVSACASELDFALAGRRTGCARIRCTAPGEILSALRHRLEQEAAARGGRPA